MITIVCTDSFTINKVDENTYELKTRGVFYNLDDFGIIFNSFDKRIRNFPFSSEEFKKIENKKTFYIEGYIFNLENDSFVCKEEINVNINLIQQSKFKNFLTENSNQQISIDISPKIMKNLNQFFQTENQQQLDEILNKFSRFEKDDMINSCHHHLELSYILNYLIKDYKTFFYSKTFEELIDIYNISEENVKKAIKQGTEDLEKIEKQAKQTKQTKQTKEFQW